MHSVEGRENKKAKKNEKQRSEEKIGTVWQTVRILAYAHAPKYNIVHIVYVIESAAYGVLFTSCLCQKPKRARYERVRAFDTNNE